MALPLPQFHHLAKAGLERLSSLLLRFLKHIVVAFMVYDAIKRWELSRTTHLMGGGLSICWSRTAFETDCLRFNKVASRSSDKFSISLLPLNPLCDVIRARFCCRGRMSLKKHFKARPSSACALLLPDGFVLVLLICLTWLVPDLVAPFSERIRDIIAESYHQYEECKEDNFSNFLTPCWGNLCFEFLPKLWVFFL